MAKTKVLFVCLGNICRSPLAEGLLKQQIEKAGLVDAFEVDSAGTGNYHIGEMPDSRTIKNAKAHGLTLNHRARQFQKNDFKLFDLIVVMDRQNRKDVERLAVSESELLKVRMLRDFDLNESGLDVPDPWFGGPEGFEHVYHLIEECTAILFLRLTKKN